MRYTFCVMTAKICFFICNQKKSTQNKKLRIKFFIFTFVFLNKYNKIYQ